MFTSLRRRAGRVSGTPIGRRRRSITAPVWPAAGIRGVNSVWKAFGTVIIIGRKDSSDPAVDVMPA